MPVSTALRSADGDDRSRRRSRRFPRPLREHRLGDQQASARRDPVGLEWSQRRKHDDAADLRPNRSDLGARQRHGVPEPETVVGRGACSQRDLVRCGREPAVDDGDVDARLTVEAEHRGYGLAVELDRVRESEGSPMGHIVATVECGPDARDIEPGIAVAVVPHQRDIPRPAVRRRRRRDPGEVRAEHDCGQQHGNGRARQRDDESGAEVRAVRGAQSFVDFGPVGCAEQPCHQRTSAGMARDLDAVRRTAPAE